MISDQKKHTLEKYATKLLQNGSALNKYMSREDNPFLVLYEYGNSNNKQGYWSFEHLVLQMQDFLDCLKVMYTCSYLVFLFDYLCGHDRAREGIIKASITRK